MSNLRHIVLFEFNADCTRQQVKEAEDRFNALKDLIPAIRDYEWGLNNSPEKANRGFTHCYFITFVTEEERNEYVFDNPHHKAFVAFVKPLLANSLVVDYWANNGY